MHAREWLHVQESAKSLLARTLALRNPPFTSLPPLHRVPLHSGHVLEIVGPSGSAKSEMLLQATVACILPKRSGGISYGGSEGAVIMIDLDCRFDMLRLVSVLQSRINDARVLQQGTLSQSKTHSEDAEDLFVSCLKRFLYIRCFNTYDFLAALKTLHAKIKRLSESNIRPHLLMIDGINAFYWTERALSSAKSSSGRKAFSVQVVSEVVVRELGQVLQIHPVLILTTKSLIRSVEREKGKAQNEQNQMLKETSFLHKDFMPAVWQGFVTHRVLLQGPFQQESDSRSQKVPFFTAEWEKPCLQQVDKFIVDNVSDVFSQ